MPNATSSSLIIRQSVAWLERAVIGLNLCPFAKAVHQKQRIRWVLSDAQDQAILVNTLQNELELLQSTDIAELETTLIVHPQVLTDFSDFNDFLTIADLQLAIWGYAGEFQIASFHPQYQFAGAAADDVTNFTNRAPYPTLHLLREASVDRATAAYPDADIIVERNLATARELGEAGWRKLMQSVLVER